MAGPAAGRGRLWEPATTGIRGRELFQKAACGACHAFGSESEGSGPRAGSDRGRVQAHARRRSCSRFSSRRPRSTASIYHTTFTLKNGDVDHRLGRRRRRQEDHRRARHAHAAGDRRDRRSGREVGSAVANLANASGPAERVHRRSRWWSSWPFSTPAATETRRSTADHEGTDSCRSSTSNRRVAARRVPFVSLAAPCSFDRRTPGATPTQAASLRQTPAAHRGTRCRGPVPPARRRGRDSGRRHG